MRKMLLLILLSGVTASAGWWSSLTQHLPLSTTSNISSREQRESQEALQVLNMIRHQVGMIPLRSSSTLQKAAQAHARYLVRYGVVSHRERSGRGGFSGSRPLDRALRVGYASRYVSENLSTGSVDIRRSIRGLFSAIYHRFIFLDPGYDEVGIGSAHSLHGRVRHAYVYLLGNHTLDTLCREPGYTGRARYVYGVCADTQHRIEAGRFERARTGLKERNPRIIVYPADGQRDVPPAFYREEPDPLPEYDVSGYPVSVAFNDRYFRKVDLISFRLFEEGGSAPLPARLLDKRTDPHHRLTRRQFALMPLQRLKWGQRYRAEIVYRHKGKRHTLRWHFTTRRPEKPLRIVSGKQESITLEGGRSYWLYFPPVNGKDVLGTMRYPEDVKVRFVDPNTLEVLIPKDRTRPFEIVGSGRKVQIRLSLKK